MRTGDKKGRNKGQTVTEEAGTEEKLNAAETRVSELAARLRFLSKRLSGSSRPRRKLDARSCGLCGLESSWADSIARDRPARRRFAIPSLHRPGREALVGTPPRASAFSSDATGKSDGANSDR